MCVCVFYDPCKAHQSITSEYVNLCKMKLLCCFGIVFFTLFFSSSPLMLSLLLCLRVRIIIDNHKTIRMVVHYIRLIAYTMKFAIERPSHWPFGHTWPYVANSCVIEPHRYSIHSAPDPANFFHGCFQRLAKKNYFQLFTLCLPSHLCCASVLNALASFSSIVCIFCV